MHQKKLLDLEKDRVKDKEFAREIQKRLQRDLEQEKDKIAEKQRIFMDAIQNQRDDFERKKQCGSQGCRSTDLAVARRSAGSPTKLVTWSTSPHHLFSQEECVFF